jgi:hypothetical protein
MRTTLDIDPHLLKRLRDEAHRRGVPFRELLTTVIRRGLEERPKAARERYRCPSYAMGSVDDTALDKALRLSAELEDEETVRKIRHRK